MSPPTDERSQPLRVVVAGGGIAAAEVLLALRELAGDRVSLTLVSPSDELVLPALSVAEPFALGHAQRYPLAELLTRAGGDLIAESLAPSMPPSARVQRWGTPRSASRGRPRSPGRGTPPPGGQQAIPTASADCCETSRRATPSASPSSSRPAPCGRSRSTSSR